MWLVMQPSKQACPSTVIGTLFQTTGCKSDCVETDGLGLIYTLFYPKLSDGGFWMQGFPFLRSMQQQGSK